MSILDEAQGGTPLEAALAAGLSNISYNAEVTFEKYVRLVLPLDGYVFWVKAGLVATVGSVYNEDAYNAAPQSSVTEIDTSETLTVQGSLHFTSSKQQAEDNSATLNSVIFTTREEVEEIDGIGPNEMFIGTFMGALFAFRERYKYYQQANLHHYRGDAINANLRSQILSSVDEIETRFQIVSNSLPYWLTRSLLVPIYPSFAVPLNLPPPYATAHIEPSSTQALQSVPLRDIDGSHWQLARDVVKFTVYGLDNAQALDFQDYLLSAAYDDSSPFGLMNTPIMRDEKLTQTEFQVLAKKKTMTLEVSYYQARMQNIVRQLILSATVSITVVPDPGTPA